MINTGNGQTLGQVKKEKQKADKCKRTAVGQAAALVGRVGLFCASTRNSGQRHSQHYLHTMWRKSARAVAGSPACSRRSDCSNRASASARQRLKLHPFPAINTPRPGCWNMHAHTQPVARRRAPDTHTDLATLCRNKRCKSITSRNALR